MAYLTVGYSTYVMPIERAMCVADWITHAEIWESKYHSNSGAGKSSYTYHIYEREASTQITVTTITPALYLGAKLAGKPE